MSEEEARSILWHCHNSPYEETIVEKEQLQRFYNPDSIARAFSRILWAHNCIQKSNWVDSIPIGIWEGLSSPGGVGAQSLLAHEVFKF